MQRIAIGVLAFLWLVSTIISVAFAQTTTGAQPPAMVATARGGTSITVQPLDDPGNPYAGQYGPWDHWVYQFYQPGFDPAQYGGG